MARPDRDLIAVVDIGKSNAKLTLTDWDSGAVVWTAEQPTRPARRGPVLDLGVEAIWDWLTERLANAPGRDRVRVIVPVAHGAAVVLLDAAGEVVCAPDYEDPAFDEVAESYAALRDPFSLTLSPVAARGLNVGRQLHFLRWRAPELFARVRHIVPYPQYWAWRFSGVLASEVTALGAHTDLWLPARGGFSPMAVREGWAALFPPPRPASDRLGPVRPDLARRLGLDPACVVLCGIHDSNASYLPHRASRADPFAVVSSGTWTIVMAHGADLAALREARDMLANVDAFGSPVGTARFMGGREYAAVAGPSPPPPDPDRLPALLASGAMALPSFALAGPFPGRPGRLRGADGLDATDRATLASLYLALVTDTMLDLLGAAGEVIVDGPLAANAAYAGVLATLRPRDVVRLGTARGGTLAGARHLARGPDAAAPQAARVEMLPLKDLESHRDKWRGLASETER